MWGNRLGWGISAAIVLIAIALVYVLVQMIGAVTEPTELVTSGLALAPIELPTSPRELLDDHAESVDDSEQDCDAGALYRQAIEHYRADPQFYERFLSQPKAGVTLRGVDLVLQAASCRPRTALFADRLEDVVMIQGNKPAIAAIADVGRATIIGGLLSKGGDPARARQHFVAAFALGAILFDERIVYDEFEAGMQLMSQASRALAGLEQDPAQQRQWTRFDERRLDYFKTNVEPVLRAVHSIDAAVVDRHAGDLARIAQEARDPMWRVEATMALGRQRFFAARVGDQRAAVRTLDALSRDPNPAVALAARNARAMTIEQYRQLR